MRSVASLRVAAAVVAGTLVLALTGCAPDDGGPQGQFEVRNRTGARILVDDTQIGSGAGIGIPVDGCDETDIVATDRSGVELGRLDRWCDGQRWTIRGPGRTALD